MDRNTIAGTSDTPDFWANLILDDLKRSEGLVDGIEKKVSSQKLLRRLPGVDNSRQKAADGLKHTLGCEARRMDWLIEDLITPLPDREPSLRQGKAMNLSRRHARHTGSLG
jgi:hypothetical protein